MPQVNSDQYWTVDTPVLINLIPKPTMKTDVPSKYGRPPANVSFITLLEGYPPLRSSTIMCCIAINRPCAQALTSPHIKGGQGFQTSSQSSLSQRINPENVLPADQRRRLGAEAFQESLTQVNVEFM